MISGITIGMIRFCSSRVRTAYYVIAFLRLGYILSYITVMIYITVDMQLHPRLPLRFFNVNFIGPRSFEMCRPMLRQVVIANELATYLR